MGVKDASVTLSAARRTCSAKGQQRRLTNKLERNAQCSARLHCLQHDWIPDCASGPARNFNRETSKVRQHCSISTTSRLHGSAKPKLTLKHHYCSGLRNAFGSLSCFSCCQAASPLGASDSITESPYEVQHKVKHRTASETRMIFPTHDSSKQRERCQLPNKLHCHLLRPPATAHSYSYLREARSRRGIKCCSLRPSPSLS